MGMSMKVEKSTVDQVKQRFEFNKKKKQEEKKQYGETYLRIERQSYSDITAISLIVMFMLAHLYVNSCSRLWTANERAKRRCKLMFDHSTVVTLSLCQLPTGHTLHCCLQEDKYKEYKREKRKERKRKTRAGEDEEEEGGIDPEMAAMMGFTGFGTKRKAAWSVHHPDCIYITSVHIDVYRYLQYSHYIMMLQMYMQAWAKLSHY